MSGWKNQFPPFSLHIHLKNQLNGSSSWKDSLPNNTTLKSKTLPLSNHHFPKLIPFKIFLIKLSIFFIKELQFYYWKTSAVWLLSHASMNWPFTSILSWFQITFQFNPVHCRELFPHKILWISTSLWRVPTRLQRGAVPRQDLNKN